MKRIRWKSQQKGTQLVEFAFVLPLIILTFAVVTEGAGYVQAHQIINNAAREGARFSAAQETSIPAVVCGAAESYAASNGISPGSWTCDTSNACTPTATKGCVSISQVTFTNDATGKQINASSVTVKIQYPVRYLPALSFGRVQSPMTMQATAEFRNLY